MSGVPPSGMVAFLFTDIEGSTRLWEEHPEAMKHALAIHDDIMRDAIAAHGGHLFSTGGDAFCAAFSMVSEAVEAGVASQLGLVGLEVDGEPLRVRMGVHVGETEERAGDYFGPVLNRSARLMSAGHGGQVLVSAAAAELLESRLPAGVHLVGLGEHRLKDLASPERIFQLQHADLASAFPALRTIDRVLNNLPYQFTAFFGREREIAEVETLLAEHRLVTISGVGGGGKTRLAMQVAAEVLDQFPDGVWFIDFAPLSDQGLIADTIVNAVGFRPPPSHPILDTLAAHFRDRTTLLVLDNCEHLVEETAAVVSRVLAATQNLRVLATSRERLAIGEEQVYLLPALPLPELSDHPNQVDANPAMQLFADRAAALDSRFALGPGNRDAVADICRRLDGLPLAIELAAARTTILHPHQIAERLDQRFRLLTSGHRGQLAHHETLEAAIDWSHDLLDDLERLLFSRLSVFRGRFSLEAVQLVCTDDRVDGIDVLEIVSRLVDKSLVVVEPSEVDRRYRLLETLRQYGSERLEAAGWRGEFEARHAGFFLALAEEAEPNLRGAKHQQWIRTLDADYDNLRQALRWNLDSKRIEQGLRLAGALYRFWHDKGRLREGNSWFQAFLAVGQDVPEQIRAKALFGAGSLAWNLGRNHQESAIAALQEAVEIYRTLAGGDQEQWEYANALHNLAAAFENRGEYGRAEASYEETLEISRRLGKPWGVAVTLTALGELAARSGRMEQARVRFKEAVAVARQQGVPRLTADTLRSIAGSETDWGNPNAAIPAYQEAIQLFTESDELMRATQTRVLLAMAHLQSGDLDRAIELFLPNVAVSFDDPDSMSYASSMVDLALFRAAIDLASGDPERAATMLGVVDALLEAGGDPNTNKELQQRLDKELHQTLEAATLKNARARGREKTEAEARVLIIEPVPANQR